MSLRNYVIRRVLFAFPLLFFISVLLFVLIHLAPGDPVDIKFRGNPAVREIDKINLKRAMGLYRPWPEQYISWIAGWISTEPYMAASRMHWPIPMANGTYVPLTLTFPVTREVINIVIIPAVTRNVTNEEGVNVTIIEQDGLAIVLPDFSKGFGEISLPLYFKPGFILGYLGISVTGASVNDLLIGPAWETAKLGIASLILSLIFAVPLGIYSARRPYSKLDSFFTFLALLGVSMPVFWTGIWAILLFSREGLLFGFKFPSGGARAATITYAFPMNLFDEVIHLVLPTIILGTAGTALILRLVRSSMLEVLRQDYILTARSKGLSERLVIYKHALRNALLPVVTVIGLSIGFLLAGAALTETVFSWPGLGRGAVEGLLDRDYEFLQALNLVIAAMVVFANLATDITYAFLDPRIRY